MCNTDDIKDCDSIEEEKANDENIIAGDNTDKDETEKDNNTDLSEASDSSSISTPEAPEEVKPTEGETYHYVKSDIPASDEYKPAGYYVPPTGYYGQYSTQGYGMTGEKPPEPTDNVKPKKQKSPKKGNGGRIAFVAVILAACLIFGTLAGFGGAMIAFSRIEAPADTSTTTPSNDSGSAQSAPVTDGNTPDLTITKGSSVSVNQAETEVSGEDLPITQVVANVAASVVEIRTEVVVTSGRMSQYVSSGAGSGVIIDKNGYIITNNHVIADAEKITVRLTNGNEYAANLVGTDDESDVALLKIIPNETLTSAVFGDSGKLLVGQEVIAIGNPLGELGGTVTNGIISALEREVSIDGETMYLMQTNAAVNPGNSGGGLFNLRGELIGIVNAKSSGTGVEGLGFAIPINFAAGIVEQLAEYGYVRGRVDSGLSCIYIGDPMTAMYYRVNTYGIYILSSKYSKEGEIQEFDRLVSINDTEITESADINSALNGLKVGDTIKVGIVRNGKHYSVNIVLQEYKPSDVSFD